MAVSAYEIILPGNALVLAPEARYVQETATGLEFAPDTPLEVWGGLVSRLLSQHKKIEWAIADAINFGERRYGEMYSQWVEQTHLAKKTLANIAWVGRKIESSRRREDVDFSYHAEVAVLDPKEQDSLLDLAVDKGLTRYELRDAVRERKQAIAGRAVDTTGAPVKPADDLEWRPQKSDLTDDVRRDLEVKLSEMSASKRSAFEAGFLFALVYVNALDCFARDGA